MTASAIGYPTRSPLHRVDNPTHLCVLDADNLPAGASRIVTRIRSMNSARGCGAYLFVDEERRAYLLSEDRPVSQKWIRDRFVWLVGCYKPVPSGRHLSVTVDGLVEDLADHLRGLA